MAEPVEERTELRRIFSSAVLACILLLVSVVLDGPVSVLAWMLFVGGILCLLYVIVACRYLLNRTRSQYRKAENEE
jgi:Ca2+/Na+ antiporter